MSKKKILIFLVIFIVFLIAIIFLGLNYYGNKTERMIKSFITKFDEKPNLAEFEKRCTKEENESGIKFTKCDFAQCESIIPAYNKYLGRGFPMVICQNIIEPTIGGIDTEQYKQKDLIDFACGAWVCGYKTYYYFDKNNLKTIGINKEFDNLFIPIESEKEAIEYLYFRYGYDGTKDTSVKLENEVFIVDKAYGGDGFCSDLVEYQLTLTKNGIVKIVEQKTITQKTAFCD